MSQIELCKDKVKAAREGCSLTQEQLAKKAGVGRRTIIEAEKNVNGMLHKTAAKIAFGLNKATPLQLARKIPGYIDVFPSAILTEKEFVNLVSRYKIDDVTATDLPTSEIARQNAIEIGGLIDLQQSTRNKKSNAVDEIQRVITLGDAFKRCVNQPCSSDGLSFAVFTNAIIDMWEDVVPYWHVERTLLIGPKDGESLEQVLTNKCVIPYERPDNWDEIAGQFFR